MGPTGEQKTAKELRKELSIKQGLRKQLIRMKLKGGDANKISGGTWITSLTEQYVAPLPKRVHTSGV